MAALLLGVHQGMRKAQHPRHQTRALGPLCALLQLLEDRVCAPATFSYAVHILLQLLQIRCAGEAIVPMYRRESCSFN